MSQNNLYKFEDVLISMKE